MFRIFIKIIHKNKKINLARCRILCPSIIKIVAFPTCLVFEKYKPHEVMIKQCSDRGRGQGIQVTLSPARPSVPRKSRP